VEIRREGSRGMDMEFLQQNMEGGGMAGGVEREATDYKRERRKERVEEYRGVTLMDTLYKVYTAVLARLEMESEEKGSVSQNQTGFRKRMGTMDNVYLIKYLIDIN